MASCNSPVGRVHSIETFGLVDGPGVRFVVFLQGCQMRCRFCHNPETWSPSGGTEYTPRQLLDKALRYKSYWGKNGGITVSGGEPLLQLDFLTEFFRLAKAKGIHTTLDTSGNSFSTDPDALERFDRLFDVTDLVLLDLKEMDPQKHRSLTGQDNAPILALARHLSHRGIPMWIRHVLVPGLTDEPAGLAEMGDFIASLNRVERVEILPYHTLGLFKWQNLGIPYSLDGVPSPTEAQIKEGEQLLRAAEYPKA